MGWYIEDYHILQGTRAEVFNSEARLHLKKSGIPVENTKGEWGCGQNELNIVYDDVMQMADNHTVFKQCLKEIADQIGLSVTFMAKPSTEGAGSSCHIYLSLWQDEQNAFCGDENVEGLHCSKLFQWFLAGWIEHLPELAVFYAPTVNSYKRYQNASWAPTGLAWSYDNRTAGFRVVDKDSSSLRIECRIPGADCNPYLAYAAVLASGLDGIDRKLALPAPFTGDAYQHPNDQVLPKTLDEAIKLFKESDFVKKAFGESVQNHYSHFFEVEQMTFTKAVTDWERKRYFERI